MREVLNLIATPGVYLGASLCVLVGLGGLAMKFLMKPARACDCPRYLLRRQSGNGLVWKTRHRIDCELTAAQTS